MVGQDEGSECVWNPTANHPYTFQVFGHHCHRSALTDNQVRSLETRHIVYTIFVHVSLPLTRCPKPSGQLRPNSVLCGLY
ncbi:hypothetical protein VTK56DRAFT_2451 [Thermocarpiscus australiensis]